MTTSSTTSGPVRRAADRVIRLAVALLLTVGMSVTLASLGASPASAATLPAGYAPNGCTLSPDRGWYPTYYDFKNSCNGHDYCYDQMWFGGGETGRAACDSWFLGSMTGWCNSYYSPWWAAVQRAQCNGVAWTYYTVVRNFGQSYFNNPYKN